MSSVADLDRLEQPIDAEPAVRSTAIRVRELAVWHGSLLAIKQVSFSVQAGEFVSLVGPSGCGKTTLLNVLTGLLPIAANGAVEVGGQRPQTGNPEIAYMLARDSLLPWRTALDNVAYGLEIRGVPRREREETARRLLHRVGLGEFVGAFPKTLSQGMRQRCALARTFGLDAAVFLMDEPFGALDAQTKIQLEDVLLDLWSSAGRTVLFVTHDLGEAIALSDRVIVMSARPGRVIADVPIDLPRPRSVRQLQQEPRFHRLSAHLWHLLEKGEAHA